MESTKNSSNGSVEDEDDNELSDELYEAASRIMENVWGKSLHTSRFHRGESVRSSISRHEIYLASQMPIRAGMRVLDIGCGVGAPTLNIAQFTGATIVGVDHNAAQIGRAQDAARKLGLGDQVSFVVGDFMKLAEQFGENSFDAVIAIEATCHAPSLVDVYTEVFKVLKPGGVFATYEVCMSDSWDPSNPEHKQVTRLVEIGLNLPELYWCRQVREVVAASGLELEYDEDLTQRSAEVPWYYPFEGNIWKTQAKEDLFRVWKMSPTGSFALLAVVRAMELLRMYPEGTYDVVKQLKYAIAAYVEGGKTKLFTPQYMVIARKPRD